MKYKRESKIVYNFVSVLIFMLFVVAELLYLKILPFGINYDIQDIATFSTVREEETSEIRKVSDGRVTNKSGFRIATVSEAYFENSLFIGDSRMVGFSIYKELKGATYYCYESADAFTILDKTYDVKGFGTMTLSDLLTSHRFDKIYVSLGINNVAAGIENHKNHYKKLLDYIVETQEGSIIYLLGNLHVTSDLSDTNKELNNYNINLINGFIESFADNRQIFYFDPNECYDDEFGNMDRELSYDMAHIYIRHYDRYLDFLMSHAVIYE